MIVVDTNIIAYLYLEGEFTEFVQELLTYDSDWIAPILWRSEFRNILSLYIRKNILTKHEAIQCINLAEDQLSGKEFQVTSIHVMELVSGSLCSAYDCEFVALAKELKVPLITEDRKIISTFPKVALSLKTILSQISHNQQRNQTSR